ncbi:MAG: hypothetical protein GY754_20525 [bacterium]|nr:hypothetical protein [bacterium]
MALTDELRKLFDSPEESDVDMDSLFGKDIAVETVSNEDINIENFDSEPSRGSSFEKELFGDNEWPEDEPVSGDVPDPLERREHPPTEAVDSLVQSIELDMPVEVEEPPQSLPEESSGEVSTIKKDLEEAKKKYYHHVVREEDKLILKKLYQKKKTLSPQEEAVYNKLNFENQKLFHIWNVEENLVSCLEYTPLSKDDHISVRESCRDIISDFEKNAAYYEKMLMGLAARGVSSSYHLIQGLCLHYTRVKFSFDLDSLIKMGQIILAKFKNLAKLKGQIEDLEYCKVNLQDYFTLNTKKVPTINTKEVKNLISRTGINLNDFIKTIRSRFDNMLMLRNELESNYEFLCYYYDLKELWYQSCIKRLQEMNTKNEVESEALILFQSIREHFIELKASFIDNGLDNFGPDGCSFRDLSETIHMTGKFLNSVYFCSYNVTKAREVDIHIRILENYLGIRKWHIETA